MAAFSSGIPLRRPWFVVLSLFAALAVIAVGMVLWQAVALSSLTAASEWVDEAKPLLSSLRFAVIGLLAILWPQLSCLSQRFGTDPEATHTRWMALRWRVVGWLLVIELIIGQNLTGRLVSVVVHPA